MSDVLPGSWAELTIGEVFPQARGASIDPRRHADREFDLFSVPAHPSGQPELVSGQEVGSAKQAVEPGTVLLCRINPRINRVWVVPPKCERA